MQRFADLISRGEWDELAYVALSYARMCVFGAVPNTHAVTVCSKIQDAPKENGPKEALAGKHVSAVKMVVCKMQSRRCRARLYEADAAPCAHAGPI